MTRRSTSWILPTHEGVPLQPGSSRFDRLASWGLVVFALVALLPLRRHGLMLLDDGWYLQPVTRMLSGEILYRDVWTFYAPGIHHALAWIFEVSGGPSILAARGLWIALIATTAALSCRFARRFVPAWLAWLPAVTYVLAPGPWHKSYYATLTIAFFVLLARTFERASALRSAALGLCVGVALVTRQDLGLATLSIALVATALPALFPAGFGREPKRAPWPEFAALLGGFAIPVTVTSTWYAARGTLPALLDAVFVRAFAQAEAHPPALVALGKLLSPASFALAIEGRAVGVLMLLPLVLYAVLGIVLARRVLRDGVRADHALLGALLGFAVATLGQAYRPMLLLRFLQSALPFYLLATIAVAQGAAWLRARGSANSAFALTASAFAAAAVLVGLVIFGLPAVQQPIYTGSARVLRYTQPVDVLGERFYEGFGVAEEIRLVRAFYDAHAAPGEPTLGLPVHALYNALVERPNPLRYVHDHPSGDFIMTAQAKQVEAERLLASPTKFVLVDQGWYARPTTPDPLLRVLREKFHPARGYGSLLILARGNDPEWGVFASQLRRALATGPKPGDVAAWRSFAAAHPNEPLAWRMLGLALAAARDGDGAVDALHRAAALDPEDVTAWEASAGVLIETSHPDAALADLERARAVRDSPTLQRRRAQLAGQAAPPAAAR